MEVLLMYPDKGLGDLSGEIEEVLEDLGFDMILGSMARGEEFLLDISKMVISNPEEDLEVIEYRQEIMKDVLRNPDIVREIYKIPIDVENSKKERWWGVFGWKTPSNILSGARGALEVLIEYLRKLRRIADEHSEKFRSRGFTRFFEIIKKELDDDYLKGLEEHVSKLRFPKGIVLKVSIGEGNEGKGYTLVSPKQKRWIEKVLKRTRVYTFKLHPRDEAGAQVLDEIRNRGLRKVAKAVACAASHIEGFFKKLRKELAFYVASLNLFETLKNLGVPLSFPDLSETNRLSFEDLNDLSLAITSGKKPVGNDLNANGKELFIITGANKGGKTTFLRSVGQAQIMAQTGMFVGARRFVGKVHKGVFTHFRKEEDRSLRMGKLEEELSRMNGIVEKIKPGSLLLLNEFMSSTNEREGSEIAYQIVRALLESGVRIFYVTHMFEFSRRFFENEKVLFLKAERTKDGRRTFKIKEGRPLQTSFGLDLYRSIFEDRKSRVVEPIEGV